MNRGTAFGVIVLVVLGFDGGPLEHAAELTAASRSAGLQACQRPPGSAPPQRGCRVGDPGEGLRYFQFSGAVLHAQQLPTELPSTKFSSGQNVVPYFDGWIRNPDGTFDLVFGYFNRNWKEELAIPAGPDNVVEPGGPDRGQPTYFLPRRQGWVFRVRVPKDFGKQVVTWTINANGRTEKAYGELLPVEEITERIVMTRGNLNPGDNDPNTPPAITIAPTAAPGVGAPIPLTAMVTDDGLPKPRAPVQRAPTATDATRIQAQANSSAGARPRVLGVTWMQVRGPAKVAFEPPGFIAVADGKAGVTARFPERGTYLLRAIASDGGLSSRADITISVGGAATADAR